MYGYNQQDMRFDGSFKDLTLDVNRLIILKKNNPLSVSVRLTTQQTRSRTSGIPNGFILPRNFVLTRYLVLYFLLLFAA